LIAYAQAEYEHPVLFESILKGFIGNVEQSAFGVTSMVAYVLSYITPTESTERAWKAIIDNVESHSTHFAIRSLSIISTSAFRAGRTYDVSRVAKFMLPREAEFDFHVVAELAQVGDIVDANDLVHEKVKSLIHDFPATYLASTFEALMPNAPNNTLFALADELMLKMRLCFPHDLVRVAQAMDIKDKPTGLPYDSLYLVIQRETVRRLHEFTREQLGPVGIAIKNSGVTREWFFPCLEAHYRSLDSKTPDSPLLSWQHMSFCVEFQPAQGIRMW